MPLGTDWTTGVTTLESLNSTMTIALYLLGGVAFVAVALFVTIFRALSVARIQSAETRILDSSELSTFEKTVLKRGGKRLERYGFVFSHFLYRKEAFTLNVEDMAIAVYRHNSGKVWAEVRKSLNFAQKRYYNIDLLSFLADGTFLLTSQEALSTHIGVPNCLKITDCSGEDLSDRVRGHLELITNQHSADTLAPEQTTKRLYVLLQAEMEHFILEGRATKAENETAQLKLHVKIGYTLKALGMVIRNIGRGRNKLDTEEACAEDAPTDSFAHALVAYHYVEETQKRTQNSTTVGKLAMLVVTAIATFIWLGQDSVLTTAALIIGIIFIHELGHFLAMLAFGYRDLTMFFIPFFGAAVSGKESDNTAPWKRIIVSFAGPLPGIFIGTILWLYSEISGDSSPFLTEAAALFVVINLFNLLPILPLDGGHIAHHTLFVRFPISQILFKAASLIPVALFGWLFDLPFLIYVAVGMALSLPSLWQKTTVIRRIRESIGSSASKYDKNALLELIFIEMQIPSLEKLPLNKKCEFAREAIQELKTPLPGIGSISLTAGLYASILAAPLLALFLLRGTALPSRESLEEQIAAIRIQEKATSKLAPNANAFTPYTEAIELWTQSDYPLHVGASKLAEVNFSENPDKTLKLAQSLRGQAKHADFKRVLQLIDLGLKRPFEPILPEDSNEEDYFDIISYSNAYSDIQHISNALAIDAINSFLDKQSTAGFRRIEDLYQLSIQVSQSRNIDGFLSSIPINQAYETLRFASIAGAVTSNSGYSQLFEKMNAAERAIDQSITHQALKAEADLIERFFLPSEAPPVGSDAMESLKDELGLWHIPDRLVALYFSSGLRDLDYREYQRTIKPSIETISELPYQRNQDNNLDAAMWSFHKLGTSSTSIDISGLRTGADLAKAKIHLAAVASMIYLNENRRGSLPDSLEGFASIKYFDAWTTDIATGKTLAYEKRENDFTLRSEISLYSEIYDPTLYDDLEDELGEDFIEELNTDTRLYWKGRLASYPVDEWNEDYFAAN